MATGRLRSSSFSSRLLGFSARFARLSGLLALSTPSASASGWPRLAAEPLRPHLPAPQLGGVPTGSCALQSLDTCRLQAGRAAAARARAGRSLLGKARAWTTMQLVERSPDAGENFPWRRTRLAGGVASSGCRRVASEVVRPVIKLAGEPERGAKKAHLLIGRNPARGAFERRTQIGATESSPGRLGRSRGIKSGKKRRCPEGDE